MLVKRNFGDPLPAETQPPELATIEIDLDAPRSVEDEEKHAAGRRA